MDGSLLVIGSMIGSGIFIVSADIARQVGSAGWLIAVWLISGFITLSGALSYGELSGMFPKAGGQYVYLRESFGRLFGFLYGWALFAVIQTGTIAAVAVAFAKFTGYFFPVLGDENLLFGDRAGFHITAAQVLGMGSILCLTWINSQGVRNGQWIQRIFTAAKILALILLIVCGFLLFQDNTVSASNWDQPWFGRQFLIEADRITHISLHSGALLVAMGVAMVGALFSSDAWNNVTFIAGEMKRPERNIGLSLFIGTLVVTILYVAINLMYLHVLPLSEIARAPADRVAVAAAEKIFGPLGVGLIAGLIMVSTFGCNNGLILSGARVHYTMAQDRLFFRSASRLNGKGVPARALWAQGIWASLLCLSGQYGNLLDFIIFTVLLFYILTISALFRLRKTRPDLPRPYRAFGYPLIPLLYILMASVICVILLIHKPQYTWPGLCIVLMGIPIYYFIHRKEVKT